MFKKLNKKDRKVVYNFLRLCGFPSGISRRVRDWNLNYILLYIFAHSPKGKRVRKTYINSGYGIMMVK